MPDVQFATDPAARKIIYQGGTDVTDGTGVAYVLGAPRATVVFVKGTGSRLDVDVAADQVGFLYLVRP